MKRNVVGWFEIYVEDMKRAKAFYESVFDINLESLNSSPAATGMELWAFPGGMDFSGASGAICKMEGCRPGNNSVLVYFSCDDVAVETEKTVKFGGRIFKPKMSIGPHGFIALVIDCEGNMIGLHSMK